MRIKSIATLSIIFLVLSAPISNAWILQSKNFPIAISEISPFPEDPTPFSDSQRCVSGVAGVFAYQYAEQMSAGEGCQLYINFPDKTEGNWQLQVLVNEGKWIDNWNSNIFTCSSEGNRADCKVAPTGGLAYRTDSVSLAEYARGDKIDSLKIGKNIIWMAQFEIPHRSSKGVCQVFTGNIDFRIRAILNSGKSIYSPPFTVSYSGDNSWMKYGNGLPRCSGSDDLDSKGNVEQIWNSNWAQYTPTSKVQSNWDAFKVAKPMNISQASASAVSTKTTKKPAATSKPKTAKTSSCSASDKNLYTNLYRYYILSNQQIQLSKDMKQTIEDARQAISKVSGHFVDYTAKDLYGLNKQDAEIAKYEAQRDAKAPQLTSLAVKCNLKMPSTTDLS